MRGAFARNQVGRLVFTLLVMPLILMAGIRLGDGPNPEVRAEHMGFDDPVCGPGWTHKDEVPPFVITAGSGSFVRVGIKSSTGCEVVFTDGSSTYGCYGVSGIGTSTVTVTQLSTGPGCPAIGHIVAELRAATSTPTTGDNTPTPTTASTPTRTATPTSSFTPTSTPTSTSISLPTRTPTKTSTPIRGTVTSQPSTPSPIAQTLTPSPTGAAFTPTHPLLTPTRGTAVAGTQVAVDHPPQAQASTPYQEAENPLALIPVTSADPCCQCSFLLMLAILILQILTIAGVLALAVYVRRWEKPRE